MPTLRPAIIAVVAPFAPLFCGRVWCHAQLLLAGTILAPAHRTVAAALRAMGLAQTKQFHRYHRVLSHARWSGLGAGRVLLRLLVAARTREALAPVVWAAPAAISPSDARSYFTPCGYPPLAQQA